MEKQRENWGSRIGFILAAAGSAVGLGNIWRFPYLTGENGGSAFILIYLVFVFLIGLSVMIAEFSIGRSSGLAAVGAIKTYSDRWTFVGVMGVLAAFLIMGFYPVVGGWALAYILESVTGLLSMTADDIGETFGAFITGTYKPIIWMLIFLGMNVLIVAKGIKGGIEKAAKVLMPTLFVLLIFIAFRSLTLEGAGEGISFLFKPDFSQVTGATYLAALGQAFFSLSLGMGCMITYGSYLSKKETLASNALIVTVLDVSVALLAGLAMFPALFAFGMEPSQGPGLVFVVIPIVFSQMGGIGTALGIIFFVSLAVAALTSSVSLMEVVVSYLIDQRDMPRKKAVYGTGVVMAITGILASLSLGVFGPLPVLKVGVFDLFDILSDKVFLGLGGMFIAAFTGWVVNKETLRKELTNDGTSEFKLFEAWHFLIKWIIPPAVAIVAVGGMINLDEPVFYGIFGSNFPVLVFGILIVVVLAIFSRKLD